MSIKCNKSPRQELSSRRNYWQTASMQVVWSCSAPLIGRYSLCLGTTLPTRITSTPATTNTLSSLLLSTYSLSTVLFVISSSVGMLNIAIGVSVCRSVVCLFVCPLVYLKLHTCKCPKRGLSVCVLAQGWAAQKRLNRSRCRLDDWLCPKDHVLDGGRDPLTGNGNFLGVVRHIEKHWKLLLRCMQQKYIPQSSITAWQRDCCSQLQCSSLVGVTLDCPPWKKSSPPCDAVFCQNS